MHRRRTPSGCPPAVSEQSDSRSESLVLAGLGVDGLDGLVDLDVAFGVLGDLDLVDDDVAVGILGDGDVIGDDGLVGSGGGGLLGSFTVACFGEYGSRTSSMTAIGALSPLRGPIFVMRV